MDNIKNRTDHLGNVFPTIKDMCEHYGITDNLYYVVVFAFVANDTHITSALSLSL